MEKDKSRGIKHIKDKKKYKGNSTKNAKYVPPKNQPNLGSNWDRYESDELNEHEHKLSSSTDFALLSNVPISTGSHFQFKNDKTIQDNDNEQVNLFCLDLDLLHRSILTIPFYERLDIEKEYFKEHEIITMEQDSQKHASTYNKFIQSKRLQETIITNSASVENVSETLQENPRSILSAEEYIAELIDDCNIKEDKGRVIMETQTYVRNNSKQDLEQWLDDILED